MFRNATRNHGAGAGPNAGPGYDQVVHIMQSYNENMTLFLQYAQLQSGSHRGEARRNDRSESNRNAINNQTPPHDRPLFQSPTRPARPTRPAPSMRPTADAITINYEFPVHPIRPTLVQIADAITFLTYRAESVQETVDPITHTEFEEGQTICQLNNCHHVFQIRSLMQWLDVQQTCPVCRGTVVDPPSETPQESPRQDLEQFFRSLFPSHTTATMDILTEPTNDP